MSVGLKAIWTNYNANSGGPRLVAGNEGVRCPTKAPAFGILSLDASPVWPSPHQNKSVTMHSLNLLPFSLMNIKQRD